MPWTAPRTYVTAEVVTAAILNTDLRDNMLETAPATVTTEGDLLYATGANALARRPVGTIAEFLHGGDTPAWGTELGNATTSGVLVLRGPVPALRIQDQGATDPFDWFQLQGADDNLRMIYHDDSDVDTTVFTMAPLDFLLHTGAKGKQEGSVVIDTDESGANTAITTTPGITYLDVTSFDTGGPAFVKGFWMVNIQRIDSSDLSSVAIIPREDGNALAGHFNYGTDNTAIGEVLLPTLNDIHTLTGTWFRRVTSSDTSDYELTISAGSNTRFRMLDGFMYVESIQYPT